METLTDTQIATRISYALRGRLSSICSQTVKNITGATRMIDDLPATAIEAMLEYVRENHRADRPYTEVDKSYKELRAACIKYGEAVLREAKAREPRLLHGIAGESWQDFAPDDGPPAA
jgi:hypothetical protein